MKIADIISIVLGVLSVIITFIGYYFKIKAKIESNINSSIDKAEVDGVDGKEKMNRVVDELYSLVPVAYRTIFKKEYIEKLVQKAFDKIEEYAKKQNKNNKLNK